MLRWSGRGLGRRALALAGADVAPCGTCLAGGVPFVAAGQTLEAPDVTARNDDAPGGLEVGAPRFTALARTPRGRGDERE